MYDPTIFENLKIGFENHIYDLDNLSGEIDITNRSDRLDLADMSREFSIQFSLADQTEIEAEIVLKASLRDFAEELLEGKEPGCPLTVSFRKKVEDVEKECDMIHERLDEIWEQEPPVQTLSYVYGQEESTYLDIIDIHFTQKMTEDQMEDIPELIEHVVKSLVELEAI